MQVEIAKTEDKIKMIKWIDYLISGYSALYHCLSLKEDRLLFSLTDGSTAQIAELSLNLIIVNTGVKDGNSI